MRDMSRIYAVIMTRIDHLLILAKAYAKATGLSEATISTRVMNDGKRLAAIRSGKDIGSRRLEEAICWFARHWPADVPWPLGISRPARSDQERGAA